MHEKFGGRKVSLFSLYIFGILLFHCIVINIRVMTGFTNKAASAKIHY